MSVPGEILEVKFNPSKSSLFTVGKDYKDQQVSFYFGDFVDGNLLWSDSMKYLGIRYISNKRFKIDMCLFLRKFYVSVNAIMTHSKCVNEDVNLCLLNFFPLLSYGLKVIYLS